MLIAVTLPIRNEEAEELIKTYNDKLLDSFKGMLIGADHFSNQTAKRRISGEPDERNQGPKFNEPHKFMKEANADHKFKQKLSETLDSAKSVGETSQLEKVNNDLEEGEKLISQGQRHSSGR